MLSYLLDEKKEVVLWLADIQLIIEINQLDLDPTDFFFYQESIIIYTF